MWHAGPGAAWGLLPTIGGVALAIAGERGFKRAGAAVLPFSQPSAVVTGGPFAFTRNPMYLGLVLCLLGWAVLLGSLVPFVVCGDGCSAGLEPASH